MSVTPANIATALGVAAPASESADFQQWAMWISDAEMLIDARATQMKTTLGAVGAAKVDYVVREAVVAQAKHPDDATQVTIAVDDASTSKTYRSGKGRVTIIDEWWTLLGLTDPDGAFTIDMAPGAAVHLGWCAIMLGAAYCSCGVDIAGYPIYEGA